MKLPRGSTLRTSPNQLTIMSYNLLAPLYVRPIDQRTGTVQSFAAFEWAEPADEVLAWDARWPRLLEELKATQADIYCLQEVQYEREEAASGGGMYTYRLPEWLHNGLLSDGQYSACLPAQGSLHAMAERNKRVLRCAEPVANALLYRTDRLRLAAPYDPLRASTEAAETASVQDKKRATQLANERQQQLKSLGADATTKLGICVEGVPGSGLSGLTRLGVFCVHLDAKSEEQRVKQLGKCLETARIMYGTRDVLLAGDLNTELFAGSCVGSMISGDGGIDGAADGMADDSSAAAPYAGEAELERECASALRLGSSGEAGGEEDDDEGGGDEPSSGQKAASGQPSAQAAMDVSDGAAAAAAAEEEEEEEEEAGYSEGSAKPSAEQLGEWRALYESARAVPLAQRIRLRRVPSEGTRAAFPHGTSCGPCISWRLDHIMYTPRTLRLARCWESLEAVPEVAARGTPNDSCPSDHIPVAAAFDLVSPPALGESDAAALVARVTTMLAQHEAERSALSTELAAEMEALESAEAKAEAAAAEAKATEVAAAAGGASEPMEAGGDADGQPGKKQKKKSKPAKKMPSEEMRTLIRSRRERERALGATHEEQKKELHVGLSWLERDALEAAAVDLER